MIPCALLLLSYGQLGSQTLLDPEDYSSPSGEYALHIEPSARDGAGPGRYHLTRGDEELWAAELPFTLFDARLTDSGATVGYAYDGGADAARGFFHEVALSPQGELLLDAKTERVHCGYVICPLPSEPRALGLVVDEEHDRFAVRINDDDYNRRMELWRVYRISTGEKLLEFRPAESMREAQDRAQVWDARPVPGTDLFLLHWGLVDFRRRTDGVFARGALFTLIELGRNVVWRLELPRDYTIEGDEEATDTLVTRVRESGMLLGTPSPGCFDIGLVKDRQRVSLRATRAPVAPGGWTVAEIRRTPFELAPRAESEPAMVETLALEPLGTVVLQRASRPVSPIRDIHAWAFAEGGGFEIIRREEPWGAFSFASNDAQGRPVRETALEPLPAEPPGEFHWAPLVGDGWLATWSPFGEGQKSRAFTVSTASGALVPLEGFDCPSVNAIAALDDGFVVLGTFHHEFTAVDGVFCFDSSGSLRWTLEQEYDDAGPDKLFSPEDLTVTTDGQVVVLDVIRHTLQVFTGEGRYLRTIDLEKAWGQQPNYPSDVSAGPRGTVLIHDFNGAPPLWHMTVKGEVIERFSPAFPDGRRVDPRNTRFAPDGHLWSTDGHSFLELDRRGVVRRVVGEQPHEAELFEAGTFATDQGRIFVQDARTGNLHAWSAEGTKLFVGRLDPELAHEVNRIGRIACDANGVVHVEADDSFNDRYFQWGAEGAYRGVVELGGNVVFDPGTGNRWVWGYHTGLTGFDPGGRELVKVDRRPDGTWIRGVEDAEASADGTVVALDPPELLFFSREGKPLRRLELPNHPEEPLNRLEYAQLASSGDWIAVHDWGPRVALVRVEDGAVFLFSPDLPRSERSSWTTGFSPDGRELWLLEEPALVVHRFALP